jgi:heme-degrading monooxygenase HmoA
MLAIICTFEVKDEVKKQLADTEAARKHIAMVIEGCKKVPGMKEKLFLMNPKTYGQGAVVVFDTQEQWEAYRKSELFKTTVLDICEGEPRIEIYAHTASLTKGVLF